MVLQRGEDGFSAAKGVNYLSSPPLPHSSWCLQDELSLLAILEFPGDFKSSNFYLEAPEYGLEGTFGLWGMVEIKRRRI